MSIDIERPTVTFATLARAMGPIAPAALARLLRGHKYRSSGPRRSYQVARRQAIDLFTDGIALDPNVPLRAYERDAICAMNRWRMQPPEWTRAVRPRPQKLAWELGGVAISMFP